MSVVQSRDQQTAWDNRQNIQIHSELEKKPPLKEMAKNTNMYSIRGTLKVVSMHMKIEKRSLQRIGHILRMDNSRLTKKITLGWP